MRVDISVRLWKCSSQIFLIGLVLWLVLAGVYRACFVWLTPMREEVSLLHYIAWLIDQHNYVPYQDVFETAFPGSLFFHTLIGRLWDYGDTAFHVFDWLWLAGLLFITGRILSLASARVAWVGVAALFAVYFAQSASMTLQRDYVGILPVALSLLFALQQNYALHWRSVTIGSLMAMAAWMKPHFLIALPVLAWVLLYPAGAPKIFSWRNRMLAVCGVIAGAVLVSAWVCVWLYVTGGLLPFLHMVSNYLPVYMGDDGIRTAVWVFLRESFLAAWVDRNIPVDLGGQNSAVDGWVWQVANIAGHLLEQFFAWLLLVGAGVWRGFALTQPKTQQRQLVIALLLLCVLFWWYPVLANKYWNYHWMPYRYFALLCGSLLLLPASNSKRWSRVVTVAAGAWFVWLMSGKLPPPNGETVQQTLAIWREQGFQQQRYPEDDLAAYLVARLQKGDRVQIIDEGGPAPRAMLLAQALPATPYLTYRQLLVNTSSPVVQKMRKDFIRRLQSTPPRFIVNTHTAPTETYAGALYQFPEMDTLLIQQYHKVVDQCNATRCFLTVWEINKY